MLLLSYIIRRNGRKINFRPQKNCLLQKIYETWTEGVAANSKGEMIRYKFDYKILLEKPSGGYGDYSGHEERYN